MSKSQLDSFFDVFTELSILGGTFQPVLSEPVRMELGRLPEPASLGLLLMGGLALLRHKRST